MDKKNQRLYRIIKAAHGLVESSDIEKQREAQSQIGHLLSNAIQDISITEFTIQDMYAEWIRSKRPHDRHRAILYCHGGGYSTGSSAYARTITSKLADLTSMEVMSFDYRLAPEHRYPNQIEDALSAYLHMLDQGFNAADIAIAGDSAGGNLALALVMELKARQLPFPNALILFSPWADLSRSGSSHIQKEKADPILERKYLDTMIANYLGRDYKAEDLTNPLVSPIYGDFSHFPRTLIQVGTNEILYSDSEILAKKMKSVGVEVTLEVYEDMWHVFQMSPFKTAWEAMEKAGWFLYE